MRFREKLAWSIVGVLSILVLVSGASIVSGGSLDPPGVPGSTMKSLDDIGGTWHRLLTAEADCESGRFICVMNGAGVLDNETGLVWQRDVPQGGATWAAATDACQRTATGGRYGWRLPSIAEFSSLIDGSKPGAQLPTNHPFTGLPTGTQYLWATWTSNVRGDGISAWYVWVADEVPLDPSSIGSGSNAHYWCVRGPGQDPSLTP